MKSILIISSVLVIAACATAKMKEGKESVKPEKPLYGHLGYTFVPGDSLQKTAIDSAYVVGNMLFMKVHYTGGCHGHEFRLDGNKAISKSMPPIRNLVLLNVALKDTCKAVVNRTLQFNIKEFAYKQEAGSEIFLNIESYDQNLKYIFAAE